MIETDLVTLQMEMAARIGVDAFFRDVPVIARNKGDVGNDIATALSVLNSRTGKTGACVVVMMPSIDSPNTEAPGPQIEILPVVRVIEKPLFNRGNQGTGVTAEAMAVRLLRLFQQWRCDALDAMMRVDRQPVRPAELGDTTAVGYDCYFSVLAGFDGSRVVEVRLAQDEDGDVTMGCATLGATIFYTTNGGYPGPETGLEYSGALTVAAGTVVRAAAYVEGRIPSGVTRIKTN